MTPTPKPRDELAEAFRKAAITLGRICAAWPNDDDGVKRLARSLQVVYRRAWERRARRTLTPREPWATPYPLLELIRRHLEVDFAETAPRSDPKAASAAPRADLVGFVRVPGLFGPSEVAEMIERIPTSVHVERSPGRADTPLFAIFRRQPTPTKES
jgi:hypothetical protein